MLAAGNTGHSTGHSTGQGKGQGTGQGAASTRIVSLDGLRGIAAIAVVVYHLPGLFGFAIPHADLAVDFFFLLSGWVMAYSYEARIGQGMPAPAFILQRMARLYPLYIVCLALAFLVFLSKMWFGKGDGIAELRCVVPNALMLPCLFNDGLGFPLNQPGWTIFVEVVLNVLWYCAVRQGLRSLGWKMAIHLLSCICLWSMAISMDRYLHGFNNSDLLEGMLRGVLGFSGGLLLFQCRQDARILLYFAALTALALAAIGLHGGADRVAPLALTVMGVLPMLIWLCARWRPALLEGRVSAFLGDISYAVYLLHIPLSLLLQKPLRLAFPGTDLLSVLLKAGVFGFVLIIASSLSYRLLEMPARRWLVQRYGRRPVVLGQVTPT